MNNLLFSTILLLSPTILLSAQNLVPNPGFEFYHNCPPYPGQIHESVAWDSPNNQTTDFFHRCADPAGGAGVPANLPGTQEPHGGDGYAGIRTWIPVIEGNPLYREYLSVQLTEPLIAGERYAVRFRVSVAEASSHLSDDIGLYFSAAPFEQEALYPLSPHIRQPEGILLKDSSDWTAIGGIYTASGGEQYLILGNFLDDTAMTREEINTGEPVVYYYIDDVEVRPCAGSVDRGRQVDTSLCAGEVLLLAGVPDAVSYRWDNGSDFPERGINGPGTYAVKSRFLCYTEETVFRVSAEDCGCEPDWPNPVLLNTGTSVSLSLPAGINELEFFLYDALGRQVSRQTAEGTLVLPALAAGAYFWRARYVCAPTGGTRLSLKRSGTLMVISE